MHNISSVFFIELKFTIVHSNLSVIYPGIACSSHCTEACLSCASIMQWQSQLNWHSDQNVMFGEHKVVSNSMSPVKMAPTPRVPTHRIQPPSINLLFAATAPVERDCPAAAVDVLCILPLGLNPLLEQVEGCVWDQVAWGADVVVEAAMQARRLYTL